ncbi:hypothetical protein CKO28_21470 [Rhodovibrio sodomensis]|uniref:Uncharacterized protein n=1 Tax=Rhodovibrio sodomensis TaxID=1088 RepID=A0ABS1DLH7_9PROT|nr:hypothetical protein [Rhodovibrio sodomensis]
MAPNLAERSARRAGAGAPGTLPDDAPAETRRLAAYLRGADARTLEQEELDPVSPCAADADAAG